MINPPKPNSSRNNPAITARESEAGVRVLSSEG